MSIGDMNRKFAQGINALWDFSKKGELDEHGLKRGFTHFLIVGGLPCLLFHDSETMIMASLGVGAASAIHAWKTEYMNSDEEDKSSEEFAEYKDMKKAKMTKSKTGLFFGKMNGNFITKRENIEGHVIVLGPTGVGKTSGYVIPSLWRWKDAVLAFDPKGGELAEKTAVFRSRFQPVYVFNPFDEKCARYNPIEHCRTKDEAQSMAEILIPKQSKENAYWEEMARSIVAAAIYEGHLENRTLVEICRFICTNEMEQLKEHYLNHPDEKVRILASPLRHLKDKTEAFVMSDLMRSLNMIAADDHIAFATSQSDWDLSELEKPATVYLSVPEEKLKLPQYRKLLNIIINQAVDHLTERKEMKEEDNDRPRILFLIDELPTLGYIPSLLQSLATLRSRGVTLSLAFQAFSQVDELYGVNGRKTIMNTARYKLILGIEDTDTQKYFTELVGTRKVKSKSITRNSEDDRYNVSESKKDVPLIRTTEWKDLDKENAVVLISPIGTAKMEKIKYFKDGKLKRMMRIDLIRSKRKQELQESVLELQEEIVGFVEEAEESAERREAK
jgi:type IV secretion system protein VirD4